MVYQLQRTNKQPELADVALSSLSEAGWTEKDLENLLATRPHELLREDKLLVIFQEQAWQEHADILALDREGTLYIFELKRVAAEKDNLLQVIRYGQIFGQYSYDELQGLWRKYRNPPSILAEAHQQYFDLNEALPTPKFNSEQRFVVVTAGVDIPTLQAIQYWKQKGMPITPLTYHVYKHGKDFLLEFHAYSPQADDYAMLLSHHHIVNSNVTHDATAWKYMLTNGRRIGLHGRKTAMNRIQKGDRVFLYHTGVGVIAYGKAISAVKKGPWGDTPDGEYFVDVNWEVKIDPVKQFGKAVMAWEINTAFGSGYTFRQTRLEIPSDMANFIEKNLKTRAAVK